MVSIFIASVSKPWQESLFHGSPQQDLEHGSPAPTASVCDHRAKNRVRHGPPTRLHRILSVAQASKFLQDKPPALAASPDFNRRTLVSPPPSAKACLSCPVPERFI